MATTKATYATGGYVMRIYKNLEFAKFGHFLHFEFDYDSNSWFCEEPECGLIFESRKKLKAHQDKNCEWDD